MKQFSDLTLGEIYEIREKARSFYNAHRDHVLKLYMNKRDDEGIAPSGSDMFHPELWKGIHWRWFKVTFLGLQIPEHQTAIGMWLKKIVRWNK